jgi:hypothetical protein
VVADQFQPCDASSLDLSMLHHWEEFSRRVPGRSTADFCSHFKAKTKSFLSPRILLEFIIQSKTITIGLFQLIYEHFGPTDHFFVRMNNFCLSLFSRNWGFGSGDRLVEFGPDGVFAFRLGPNSAHLRNNSHEIGYWYTDAEGRRCDVEAFFERQFPMEVPSETILVSFMERNFPETLFQDEEEPDNEEET